ncbi:MAG: hypothetical protein WC860_00895 [Candidatus Margulisiibacteriota bacterium]
MNNGLFAEPLTQDDFLRIRPQKIVQHILYETYINTDQGGAGVFGYHFDTYFTENIYFPLAIFGAVMGGRGGYGIAAFGLGYNLELMKNLCWDSTILIGTGGGGGLPCGNGLAFELQSGLSYEIIRNFSLEFRVGYLTYPSDRMSTPIINFGCSLSSERLILK